MYACQQRSLIAACTFWLVAALRVPGAPPAPPPLASHSLQAVFVSDDSAPPEAPEEARRPDDSANASNGSSSPGAAAAGSEAFNRDCTQCHGAERALSKSKSIAGWRSTIRRMAAKPGADIPEGDWEAIAAYLAAQSRTGGGAADSASGDKDSAEQSSAFSLNATLAPLWRGGSDRLENPGFFPDTWIMANWQGTGGLSGRVTVCATCHSEAGQSDRLALAEAALRLDLKHLFSICDPAIGLSVDAGRLLVPFGAYSAQSNPGAQRMVTKPLVFNMGQNVRRAEIGNPVLPMPYADEGVNLALSAPLWCEVNTTLDVYAVNGLQGASSGIDFFASREYVDNNFDPAVGARWTLGGRLLRFGGSLMGGRFNLDSGSGPQNSQLDYQIWGLDVVARNEDRWRIQAEYARRDSDRVVQLPGQLLASEHVDGYYVEGEWRICTQPRTGFTVRYDAGDRDSPLPPPGSTLNTGGFGTRRFTYGVNVTLPGGSLLMVNHERWFLPGNLENIDVLGLRWVASF